MRARVRASFARQAMMATLGMELVSVERGRVELAMRHDARFTQQHGFLHAGAVAAALDSACGYAAFSVMPPEAAVLTVAYSINLLAPAAGERFTMTGTVVRAGRTLVVCRGEAPAGKGRAGEGRAGEGLAGEALADEASADEALAGGAAAPFAVMQATLAAVCDRPGIRR
jgi:uncharacterized protein (TIGR00369 family)